MKNLINRLLIHFLCSAIFVTSAFALDISSADADSWKFKSKNGKTKLIAKGINLSTPLSNYFAAGMSICLKPAGGVADTNDLRKLTPKTKKNGKVNKWFFKKKKDAVITYIPKKNLLKCKIWKEFPDDSVIYLQSPDPADMALVPEGSFSMGDHYGIGAANEHPVHSVYISSFYIDKYEVTNEKMKQVMQWAYDNGKIMANSSSITNSEGNQQRLLNLIDNDCHISFAGGVFSVDTGKDNFPCVEVSWYGAQAYCNYKSDLEGLERCINFSGWICDWTKNGYRLPTEAEWEKAARGDLNANYYPWASYGGNCGDHIDGSKANYWYSGDPYDNELTPCGYYNGNQIPTGTDMTNGYGLYDVAGNAWEWCWDYYSGSWYSNTDATNVNTRGPEPSSWRILRSASWEYSISDLRCAYRGHYEPAKSTGRTCFRSVRPAF